MAGIKMRDYITFDNVLELYEKEISKHVKNKRKLLNFEVNKIQNINNIVVMLNNKDVGHYRYNIFLIYEPKCRLVMSLSIQDKIINHFVTRYILEKKLTKYLDIRNVATRKNMGTSYARKMLINYIKILKKGNKDVYALKIDISKYFYSIDHNLLKDLIKDKIDDYEYDLLEKIIDSTNKPYINEIIDKYRTNQDIPYYLYGKGLPIGNMTSQFLSIFYLYKLDHYIVHNLGIKYYIRYMDDFILLSNDLEKLKMVKEEVTKILYDSYKLKVSKNKTFITNIKHGISFLGYTFKIVNTKLVVKIKKCNYERIKYKMRNVTKDVNLGFINLYQGFSVIMNYKYSYKLCSNNKIMDIISRYWKYEK